MRNSLISHFLICATGMSLN